MSSQYTRFTAEGYTEEGAGGANLTVESETYNSLEFGIGVDAKWQIDQIGGGTLTPVLRAGITYDVLDDPYTTQASFAAGSDPFTSVGPDREQFNLSPTSGSASATQLEKAGTFR